MARTTTAGRRRQEAGFATGERGPDFMLPNPDGKLGRFYDRFTGNAVVLFFSPSAGSEKGRRELEAFAAQAPTIEKAGAKIVAVAGDSVEGVADMRDRHGIDFTLFADPAGAITRGYGADCSTYLLDRNQRVLAVRHGGAGHAAWALAGIEQEDTPGPGRNVTVQAPVLLLPNVVEPEMCRRAIAAWQADHAEGAVRVRGGGQDVGTRVVNHGMKKRLDHRPDEAMNRALTEAVVSRIGPELFKAFQFQAVAAERFCIAAYEAERGDYFKPHRDNTTPQTERRRFAVTVNLNDDYEGGGVWFPEFSEDVYSTGAGGALVFSCSLMHEALPVSRGTRFAALSFLFGPGDVPAGPAR